MTRFGRSIVLVLKKLRKRSLIISQFVTKAQQILIVYTVKLHLDATCSQFWGRKGGEHTVKLLLLEICGTKRSVIMISTEGRGC